MKILIPGGHLTPALALIDYLQLKKSSDEIIFAGRIYSQKKLKQKALEKIELEKRGITFVPFQAVKLGTQSIFYKLFIFPLAFVLSLYRALKLVNRYQPTVLLSFGAYLALPLAIICYLKKIPIVTHEQARVLGRANRLIAKLADKVCLSYVQTAQELKKTISNEQVVVTGNPLRPQLFAGKQQKPSWFNLKLDQT